MGYADHPFSQGAEQRLPAGHLARHQHVAPYAALVLQGGYLERGSSGRWRVEAGWVVRHQAYEAHDNQVWTSHAHVLNIPLPFGTDLPAVFSVAAPDELVHVARRDPQEVYRLLTPLRVKPPDEADWPDLLAASLQDVTLHLADWSGQMGLAPATVTRGFHAAFGVTPARFRSEARLVRAVARLSIGTEALAQVAAECGFSDQAHMSRTVLFATGRTPSQWRKIKTVQDQGVARA